MRSVDDNLAGIVPGRAAKSASKSGQISQDMDAAKQRAGFSSAFADAGRKNQPAISIAAKPQTEVAARPAGHVPSSLRTSLVAMPVRAHDDVAADAGRGIGTAKEMPAIGRTREVPAVLRDVDVPAEGLAKKLIAERAGKDMPGEARAKAEPAIPGDSQEMPSLPSDTEIPAEGLAKKLIVERADMPGEARAKAAPVISGNPQEMPALRSETDVPAEGLAKKQPADLPRNLPMAGPTREPSAFRISKENASKENIVQSRPKHMPAEIVAKTLPVERPTILLPTERQVKISPSEAVAKIVPAETAAKELPAFRHTKEAPEALSKKMPSIAVALDAPSSGRLKETPIEVFEKKSPLTAAKDLPALGVVKETPVLSTAKALPSQAATKDVVVSARESGADAKTVRLEARPSDPRSEARTKETSAVSPVKDAPIKDAPLKDATTKVATLLDVPAKIAPQRDVPMDSRDTRAAEKAKISATPVPAARETEPSHTPILKSAQPSLAKIEPETAIRTKAEPAMPVSKADPVLPVSKAVAAPDRESAAVSGRPPAEARKLDRLPQDTISENHPKIGSQVETPAVVVPAPAQRAISVTGPQDSDQTVKPSPVVSSSQTDIRPPTPILLPSTTGVDAPPVEDTIEGNAAEKATALLESPKVPLSHHDVETRDASADEPGAKSPVDPADTMPVDVNQLLQMLGVAPGHTTAVPAAALHDSSEFAEFQALADRAGEIRTVSLDTADAKPPAAMPDDRSASRSAAGASDQVFRFARADGKGQPVSMSLASDGDKTVAKSDLQASASMPAKMETVTVLEARRYLGLAPASNAAVVTSQISTSPEWAPVLKSGAEALTPTVPGSAGKALDTLKIQMNPIDLGMVTATLRLKDDELHVQLRVETGEAFRQLSDDQGEMVKALRAQGFAVDQVSVVFNAPDRSGADTTAQQAPSYTGQGRETAGEGAAAHERGQQNDGNSQQQSRGRWAGNDGKSDASSAADAGGTGDVYM